MNDRRGAMAGLLIASLVLWLLPGCPPTNPGGADAGEDVLDADRDEVVVDVGRIGPDGQFIPLQADDSVEIVVGFQGLIYIEVALRVPADSAAQFSGSGEVHFSDSSHDFTFRNNAVNFEPAVGSFRRCPAFRVPFGQDLSLLDGQTITLDVELTSPAVRAAGSATFQIVDEES